MIYGPCSITTPRLARRSNYRCLIYEVIIPLRICPGGIFLLNNYAEISVAMIKVLIFLKIPDIIGTKAFLNYCRRQKGFVYVSSD